MNRRHIEARVPRTHLRWMVTRFDGHAFQINKRSTVDQSGKANIVPDGNCVALCGVMAHELNVGLAPIDKPSSRIMTLKSVGRSEK
jgi:hypothetical protein